MCLRKYLLTLITSSVLILCNCTQNPEEKANKLFVDSTTLLSQAKIAENESYRKALQLYNKAQKKISIITTKYPGTDLALRITQNDVKFYSDGYELPIYNLKDTIIPVISKKAIAESAPIFLSEFLIDTFPDTLIKIQTYIEIYYLYDEMGQADHATKTKNKIIDLINKYYSSKSEYYDKILEFSTYLEKEDKNNIFGSLTPIKNEDVLNAKLFLLKGNSKPISKILNEASVSINDKFEIIKFFITIGKISEAEKLLRRFIDDISWTDLNNLDKIEFLQLMSKTNLKKDCLDLLNDKICATNNYNSLIRLAEIYAELGQNENAGNILQRAIGFLEVDTTSSAFKIKEYYRVMKLYDKVINIKAKSSIARMIKYSYDNALDEKVFIEVGKKWRKINVNDFSIGELKEYWFIERRITPKGNILGQWTRSGDIYLFKKVILPYLGLSCALLGDFKESLKCLITIEDYQELSMVLIEFNRIYFSKTKRTEFDAKIQSLLHSFMLKSNI